jgi:hypothetical protein
MHDLFWAAVDVDGVDGDVVVKEGVFDPAEEENIGYGDHCIRSGNNSTPRLE